MSEFCQPQRPPLCSGCDAPSSAGFPSLSSNVQADDPLIQTMLHKLHQQQIEQREWIQCTLTSTLKEHLDVPHQKNGHVPSTHDGSTTQRGLFLKLEDRKTLSQKELKSASSSSLNLSTMSRFWDRFDDDAIRAGQHGYTSFEEAMRKIMATAEEMLLASHNQCSEKQQNDCSNSHSEVRVMTRHEEGDMSKCTHAVCGQTLPKNTNRAVGPEQSHEPLDVNRQQTPYLSETSSETRETSEWKAQKFRQKSRAFTVETLDAGGKNGLQSVFHEHGHQLSEIVEDLALGVNIETKRVKLSFWNACRSMFPIGTIVESLMGLLVVLDCAAIGVKTAFEQDGDQWVIWDASIALMFSFERSIRIMVTGCRMHYLGPGARWNTFETTLVLLMIAELCLQLSVTDDVDDIFLTVLRLLRLGRIVRIFRLTRLAIFSDLLMLLNGAAGGLKTLMWSIILISVPIYMVSLILTSSLYSEEPYQQDDPSQHFSTLPRAAFTLFRCVVAQECTDEKGQPIFLRLTKLRGWQYGAIYCVTHTLMTFGLFNVIVAIYVDNTVAAAKTNETQKRKKRLMDTQYFTLKIKEVVEFVYRVLKQGQDFDGNEAKVDLNGELCFADKLKMEISPEGFAELRQFKEFQDLLRDLDIADESQMDFFKTLDVDGGGTIDLEELVAGLTLLRGDARRSDIVGVSLVVRSLQSTLIQFETSTREQLRAQSEQLVSMEKKFSMLQAPEEKKEMRASVREKRASTRVTSTTSSP